jgi:hypothetical protein
MTLYSQNFLLICVDDTFVPLIWPDIFTNDSLYRFGVNIQVLAACNQTGVLALTQVVADAYLMVLMWKSRVDFLVGTMFAK